MELAVSACATPRGTSVMQHAEQWLDARSRTEGSRPRPAVSAAEGKDECGQDGTREAGQPDNCTLSARALARSARLGLACKMGLRTLRDADERHDGDAIDPLCRPPKRQRAPCRPPPSRSSLPRR